MKWLIVGLGNPGKEYEYTRHNAGRELALILANKWGDNKDLKIIAPDTFMNKSGNAVTSLIKSAKAAERLVVMRDDLDLPLGRVKMIFNRGSGGHRGVESVRRAVKTEGFIQIKIGISGVTPKGKVKKPKRGEAVQKFILGKFKPAEIVVLKKVYKKITEGLEILVKDGREAAMNKLNTV